MENPEARRAIKPGKRVNVINIGADKPHIVDEGSPEHQAWEENKRAESSIEIDPEYEAAAKRTEALDKAAPYLKDDLQREWQDDSLKRDAWMSRVQNLSTPEGYRALLMGNEIAPGMVRQPGSETDRIAKLEEARETAESWDRGVRVRGMVLNAIGAAETGRASGQETRTTLEAAKSILEAQLDAKAAEVQRLWKLQAEGTDLGPNLERNTEELAQIQDAFTMLTEKIQKITG